MLTLKEVEKNLKFVQLVKDITKTYQDIANLKMRQTRQIVLRNRELFEVLMESYQKVQLAYVSETKKKRVKRKEKKEKLVVFLSTNGFLYGNLIWEIWQKVQDYLREEKADLLVAGRVGKYFAQRAGFGARMFYFELSETKLEKEKIKGIIDFIKDYQRVIVFFGKYKGGLIQKPAKEEISERLPSEKEATKTFSSYLFEPSVEAILDFFEKEILAVLFNLTLLEHRLACYSARVRAMSEATERAKKAEKKYFIIKNRLKRELLTKKQIEYFGALL